MFARKVRLMPASKNIFRQFETNRSLQNEGEVFFNSFKAEEENW